MVLIYFSARVVYTNKVANWCISDFIRLVSNVKT